MVEILNSAKLEESFRSDSSARLLEFCELRLCAPNADSRLCLTVLSCALDTSLIMTCFGGVLGCWGLSF